MRMLSASHFDDEVVLAAQRVAYYALTLGVMEMPRTRRYCYEHFGALIADAVLQSGLNYRTVVYPRVQRILKEFPEINTLAGVKDIIGTGNLNDFLMWKHPTKLQRFYRITRYFDQCHVETTKLLRDRMTDIEFQGGLLNIHGIGPKTVDYISCISGVETIAVDRHILKFADEAGVKVYDYESAQEVFSFAADLLDISRRSFDSWVWNTVSSR